MVSALVVMASLAGVAPSGAQIYPNKLIRIVVPSSPGTAQDVIARIIAPDMSRQLGQNIIVENKTGADQVIGLEYVAKQQPPDGYTLSLVATGSLITLPIFAKDLHFDPLNDLPPIVTLTEQPYLFGSSVTKPWKNFKELVAALKAAPGKYNFGSANNDNRLIAELILRGSEVTARDVAYSQAGVYLTAMASGEVDMGVMTGSAAASLGDMVRVLGITGAARSPSMPNVPTFAELGLEQVPSTSFSLNVAAGTPKTVTDKLYAAATHALRQSEVQSQFAKLNMKVVADSTVDAVKRQSETAKLYNSIAKQIGL
jgi:tripartite-type tricarboxylate transporter receptor subunit TctC